MSDETVRHDLVVAGKVDKKILEIVSEGDVFDQATYWHALKDAVVALVGACGDKKPPDPLLSSAIPALAANCCPLELGETFSGEAVPQNLSASQTWLWPMLRGASYTSDAEYLRKKVCELEKEVHRILSQYDGVVAQRTKTQQTAAAKAARAAKATKAWDAANEDLSLKQAAAKACREHFSASKKLVEQALSDTAEADELVTECDAMISAIEAAAAPRSDQALNTLNKLIAAKQRVHDAALTHVTECVDAAKNGMSSIKVAKEKLRERLIVLRSAVASGEVVMASCRRAHQMPDAQAQATVASDDIFDEATVKDAVMRVVELTVKARIADEVAVRAEGAAAASEEDPGASAESNTFRKDAEAAFKALVSRYVDALEFCAPRHELTEFRNHQPQDFERSDSSRSPDVSPPPAGGLEQTPEKPSNEQRSGIRRRSDLKRRELEVINILLAAVSDCVTLRKSTQEAAAKVKNLESEKTSPTATPDLSKLLPSLTDVDMLIRATVKRESAASASRIALTKAKEKLRSAEKAEQTFSHRAVGADLRSVCLGAERATAASSPTTLRTSIGIAAFAAVHALGASFSSDAVPNDRAKFDTAQRTIKELLLAEAKRPLETPAALKRDTPPSSDAPAQQVAAVSSADKPTLQLWQRLVKLCTDVLPIVDSSLQECEGLFPEVGQIMGNALTCFLLVTMRWAMHRNEIDELVNASGALLGGIRSLSDAEIIAAMFLRFQAVIDVCEKKSCCFSVGFVRRLMSLATVDVDVGTIADPTVAMCWMLGTYICGCDERGNELGRRDAVQAKLLAFLDVAENRKTWLKVRDDASLVSDSHPCSFTIDFTYTTETSTVKLKDAPVKKPPYPSKGDIDKVSFPWLAYLTLHGIINNLLVPTGVLTTSPYSFLCDSIIACTRVHDKCPKQLLTAAEAMERSTKFIVSPKSHRALFRLCMLLPVIVLLAACIALLSVVFVDVLQSDSRNSFDATVASLQVANISAAPEFSAKLSDVFCAWVEKIDSLPAAASQVGWWDGVGVRRRSHFSMPEALSLCNSTTVLANAPLTDLLGAAARSQGILWSTFRQQRGEDTVVMTVDYKLSVASSTAALVVTSTTILKPDDFTAVAWIALFAAIAAGLCLFLSVLPTALDTDTTLLHVANGSIVFQAVGVLAFIAGFTARDDIATNFWSRHRTHFWLPVSIAEALSVVLFAVKHRKRNVRLGDNVFYRFAAVMRWKIVVPVVVAKCAISAVVALLFISMRPLLDFNTVRDDVREEARLSNARRLLLELLKHGMIAGASGCSALVPFWLIRTQVRASYAFLLALLLLGTQYSARAVIDAVWYVLSFAEGTTSTLASEPTARAQLAVATGFSIVLFGLLLWAVDFPTRAPGKMTRIVHSMSWNVGSIAPEKWAWDDPPRAAERAREPI